MKRRLSLKVHGTVQGVGFRYFTKSVADQMDIYGTVKNNSDGTVSIQAEAEGNILKDFLERIKLGPSIFSKVTKLDVKYNDSLKEFTNFSIIS